MNAGSRFVSLSVAIDFTELGAYLQRVNKPSEPRITLQHVVCRAVGQLYTEFPVANRRVVGSRIYQAPSVGIAAPVNLIGSDGEKGVGETSMMLLPKADTMTLVEIAAKSRRAVRQERAGRMSDPVARWLVDVLGGMPGPVFRSGLRAMDVGQRLPGAARLGWKAAPVTTAVSNVGAVYGSQEGTWFRGASYHPPSRIVHVGSLWGVAPLQEEVVPVDGHPAVRTVVPLVLCFDHRIFDGVIATKLMIRMSELLRNPDVHFGADGRR